jgi:hypothetical protein
MFKFFVWSGIRDPLLQGQGTETGHPLTSGLHLQASTANIVVPVAEEVRQLPPFLLLPCNCYDQLFEIKDGAHLQNIESQERRGAGRRRDIKRRESKRIREVPAGGKREDDTREGPTLRTPSRDMAKREAASGPRAPCRHQTTFPTVPHPGNYRPLKF